MKKVVLFKKLDFSLYSERLLIRNQSTIYNNYQAQLKRSLSGKSGMLDNLSRMWVQINMFK